MRAFVFAVGLLFACVTAMTASAETVEEKAAVCATCHGENGKPISPEIPVIWGQHEGYLYIQLRDYKRGDRTNELMSGIAAGLEKADMQALAKYFSEKPWTNLEQKSSDAAMQKRAESVASSAQCAGCHLGGFLGDSVNPRLAGQSEGYLFKTMTAFRSGERKNNSWMVALLKTYSDEDILALSKYLAGL